MARMLYKPTWRWVITDLVSIVLSYLLILYIVPTTNATPILKYWPALTTYAVTWLLTAYLIGRYQAQTIKRGYIRATLQEFVIYLLSVAIDTLPYYLYTTDYSYQLLLLYATFTWGVSYLLTSLRYAYQYASDPEEDLHPVVERGPKQLIIAESTADPKSQAALRQNIENNRGRQAMEWISAHSNLGSTAVTVLLNDRPEQAQVLPHYQYHTVICLVPLDRMRGINRMLSYINEALPDNGQVICCVQTKSTRKRKLLAKYPYPLNNIIYLFDYLVHRVLPKLFITKRLYYDLTQGRHRILSLTEILGRLCYCGYEIQDRRRIGDHTWISARRVSEPPMHKKRRYGPFISLRRVGKGGKTIRVYKMRTMYPYSEYLQSYIYKKYQLQEGGKFNHDIRINGTGRFMRKYWIDELPMLVNLLKGDLKIVGVRPLSKQYMSLYDADLQQMRSRVKPGLLPPFYADLPKTLPEIQESERKYLTLCSEKGTLRTDHAYFWQIVRNILFKKARSH